MKDLVTPNANGEILITKFIKYCSIVCTEFEKFKFHDNEIIQNQNNQKKCIVNAIKYTGSNRPDRDILSESISEESNGNDSGNGNGNDSGSGSDNQSRLLGCKYLTSSQV